MGQGEPFDVHLVVGEEVDLDREEGSGADVEGEVGGLDALLAEGLDQFGGEVQSGGGGGDGSGMAGIDGLIPFLIQAGGGTGGPFDIRWKREFAVTFGEGDRLGSESEETMTLGILVEECGVEGIGIGAETELGTGAYPFAGSEQDPPFERGGFFEEQDFDLALGIGLMSAKAGGDDFGIVEDQEITGSEPMLEIGEPGVVVKPGGAVEDEEAGGIPLEDRRLGDEFLGEEIIEVSDPHDGGEGSTGGASGEVRSTVGESGTGGREGRG